MNTEPEIEQSSNITSSTGSDQSKGEIDDDIVKQFKIIMLIVLVVLIAFLGFFVYNLIKCYLPKWRGRANQECERRAEISTSTETKNNIEIEFESN